MKNLFTCAANDDTFTMSKLISNGADVNKANSNNETPLHVAAIHGSLKAAKCLLSSGADPNLKTNLFEESPLHFAVQQGNKQIITLLFDAGADPNSKNCDGENPVFTAVRWSNANVIPLLAERGSNLTEINNLGQTALSLATNFNSRSLVKALLDCGVTPETSGVSKEEIKPLTENFPCINNAERMSKPMTANSTRRKKGGFRAADNQMSMLFDFVSNNQVNDLKEKMKEGIKVNNTASFNGETLLHAATLYGATECVDTLIKAGANVNAKTELDQVTALHISVREGYFDIFHLLLKAGADIEAQDSEGETPIFTAVKFNRVDMFRALTRKGANVNHANLGNLTPIQFAVLASNKFMIQSLLYYGASFENDEFNSYMFAFKAQDSEIAAIIQDKEPKLAKATLLPKNIFQIIRENKVDELEALITKGFKLDLVDNLEGSPLHCAVRYNANECMDLLIKKGANVNVLDVQNRETPLMTSINTNETALNTLLENPNVDYVTIRNKDGETTLFYAIRAAKPFLVHEFIQRGADVNELNNDGLSPLYVAISLRLDEIVQILLDNGANQETELHPSIKLAKSMKDKKIIDILTTTAPKNVRESIRTSRCEARRNRSALRPLSPPRAATRAGTRPSTSLETKERATRGACNDGMCFVCHRNKATQKLVPCGHVIACRGCIKEFIENQGPCPVCGLKFYATKTVCDE